MDDERWYTVAELAERWSLNAEVVRRWIRAGKVEALELGGKAGYRVRASEVERFEQERMTVRQGDGLPSREASDAAWDEAMTNPAFRERFGKHDG